MLVPTVAIVLATGCGSTNVINETSVWNAVDQEKFEVSVQQCAFYYPDTPCLKRIEKMEENVYNVFCAAKEAR